MELNPLMRTWLESIALPGRRVGDLRRLSGGYSNDNILVGTLDGSQFVLRRYLRKNSCAVEVAIASRLAGLVPVPEVVAADTTGAEAGEPVLLSVFVPGPPVTDVLADAGEPEVTELGRSVGATLARIGEITFPAPGFFTDERLEPGPPGIEPTADLDKFVLGCLRDGNGHGHLDAAEQQRLVRFAEQAMPGLEVLRGSRRLVHADYNPKNLLATRRAGRWQVAAVLDWEFAYSSSPLFDLGNMLRVARPVGYEAAFVNGFSAAGGELPADWRRLAHALDLYSLASFLTRPADHRYFRQAVELIKALLAAG